MEQASGNLTVTAGGDACFRIASDIERYPDWLPDVRGVVVLERDDTGRPRVAAFQVGAFGRTAEYILVYDFTHAPRAFSWTQREGDLTYALDGSYTFDDRGDGSTEVAYSLAVGLRVPLPGFIRRRAEALILEAALSDLKREVESRALA